MISILLSLLGCTVQYAYAHPPEPNAYVVYHHDIPETYVHRYWVPGYYDARGYWINGYWTTYDSYRQIRFYTPPPRPHYHRPRHRR